MRNKYLGCLLVGSMIFVACEFGPEVKNRPNGLGGITKQYTYSDHAVDSVFNFSGSLKKVVIYHDEQRSNKKSEEYLSKW